MLQNAVGCKKNKIVHLILLNMRAYKCKFIFTLIRYPFELYCHTEIGEIYHMCELSH